MKVVNSSFFGFYNSVSCPKRAAVLLGVDIMKGLVLGVHFLKELNTEILGTYSVKKLWEHCLQTGYCAKTIAASMQADNQTITNCFVSGILHDIGKFVFTTEMNEKYREVLQVVREQGGPITKREKETLGVTHAEVGAYILGLWGFNETIVNTVYYHHNLEHCGDNFEPAHAVHVADVLQHELAPHESGYVFSELNENKLAYAGILNYIPEWRDACCKIMENQDGQA